MTTTIPNPDRKRILGNIGLHLASLAWGGQIAPEDVTALSETIRRLMVEDHECLQPVSKPREKSHNSVGVI